jgi:Na+-transporting NADH:ubiquinone oxidoreductase subunit D
MKSSTQAKGQSLKTFLNGVWRDHPIFSMILGICSALAVSNKVENAIAMGAGVTFVLLATGLLIAMLRRLIPTRVRMITYMIIIATFVIVVDRVLKALFPDISQAIGPYVGLIITNCIIMGRCEAFARHNPPLASFLDGLGMSVGYSLVLIAIAFVREPLGFGTILGYRIMPEGFVQWTIMIMAPGAFFTLGIFVWIMRSFRPQTGDETG